MPIKSEAIRGSREFEINMDKTYVDTNAIHAPKRICLVGLFGVVIGSGSMTVDKNKTVGSSRKFIIDNLPFMIVLIRVYAVKNDSVIRNLLMRTIDTRDGESRMRKKIVSRSEIPLCGKNSCHDTAHHDTLWLKISAVINSPNPAGLKTCLLLNLTKFLEATARKTAITPS